MANWKCPEYSEDQLRLFVVVSGAYQWYVPMWRYCASRAYPEAKLAVIWHGSGDSPTPDPEAQELSAVSFNQIDSSIPVSGPSTACLRFLIDPSTITGSDCKYTLITDVDVLHRREEPDLIKQHLSNMAQNDLGAYSNYIHNQGEHLPRMQGVHFATQAWWKATAEERKIWTESLTDVPPCDPNQDEYMLASIAINSGLKTSTGLNLWQTHGIHLGSSRGKQRPHPMMCDDMTQWRELYNDVGFMNLARECAKHSTDIDKIFRLLKRLL